MNDIIALANCSSLLPHSLLSINNPYYSTVSSVLVHLQTYTRDTVEHLLIACALYATICILLYFCVVKWNLIGFECRLKNAKRVLVVTAHPDDECMFFGPTLVHLNRCPRTTVFLMCLSSGHNYGMEKIRKKELYKSCEMLGIPQANITVYRHTCLPDEMGAMWPVEVVSKLILQQVQACKIDTLITFDRWGVSYHKNHSSIYYAVAHLRLERTLPQSCTVYVLETVSILRKYWLWFDIPISFVLSRKRFLAASKDRSLIHKAMRQHQSQLVWFRRLYMVFSRYMLINSLQQMDLSDIELDLSIDD